MSWHERLFENCDLLISINKFAIELKTWFSSHTGVLVYYFYIFREGILQMQNVLDNKYTRNIKRRQFFITLNLDTRFLQLAELYIMCYEHNIMY